MTSILFLFDVFLTALDVVTLDVTYNRRIGE